MIRVLQADFVCSATGPSDGAGWPEEGPAEVAFAGRSNVGKSTLLGALLGRKGLVRTSSTPGRTRLINFFRLLVATHGTNVELRFVDLPGFGYAKVSKSERATWRPFIEAYLGRRQTLRACVLLVDARRGPELDETELARWLGERQVAVIVALTKIDKLAKHERRPAVERVRRQLGAAVIPVSATQGDGVITLWERLGVALKLASE